MTKLTRLISNLLAGKKEVRDDATKNHTEGRCGEQAEWKFISGNGELQGRSNDVPAYISSFYASRSSAIYGASSHVTPVNSTIRVWKRTA